MPFGNRQQQQQQSITATQQQQQQQQSILARTLFEPAPVVQVPQQQSQQEAIIVQSDSNVVSDEIIQQLQAQFGEAKQIYVLNTDEDENVQYLVVDKDADISAILRDTSLFSTQNSSNQQQSQSQVISSDTNQVLDQLLANTSNQISHQQASPQVQQQQQQQPPPPLPPCMPQTKQQNKLNNLTANFSSIPSSLAAIEESIQRVSAPLPKRKIFEFQLDNKKNSYQDAFLRFLAGEKQPSLEIIAEQVNRKPKENTYNMSTTTKSKQNPSQVMPITNGTTNGTNVNTTNGTFTDKENYYNSSRRENLLPLNNYEYRNSYKDHYDNQGVRLNPAILKQLPPEQQSTMLQSSTNPSSTSTSVTQTSNVNRNPAIIITGSNGTSTGSGGGDISALINDNVSISDLEQSPLNPAKSLSDHTYKSKQQLQQQQQQQQQHATSAVESQSGKTTQQRKRGKSSVDSQEDDKSKKKLKSCVTVDTSNEVTFTPGEFLIHKLTFSDMENFDIWCVRDDGYLQKYEPVLLSTGERCHQSADVLAQYTANKAEFIHIKVEEKGKTEQNNVVVCVLAQYEPKNNEQILAELQAQESQEVIKEVANDESTTFISTYDELKPTFDVFLQILLSQFLNSEFLMRIREIQDDYFKPAWDIIDTIINQKYALLSEHAKFVNEYKQILDEKPKMSIVELGEELKATRKCEALWCDTQTQLLQDNQQLCEYLVKFFGLKYNSSTLAYIDDGKDLDVREFYVSVKGAKLTELYHTLKHMKIQFYEICSVKVEIIRAQINDQNNGASDILNICLADTQWLSEVFDKFKKILIDFDQTIGLHETTPTTDEITTQVSV